MVDGCLQVQLAVVLFHHGERAGEALRQRCDAEDGVGCDFFRAAGFAHAIGAHEGDAAILHDSDSETDKVWRGGGMVEHVAEFLELLVLLCQLRMRGHRRGERQCGGSKESGKLQDESPRVRLTIAGFVNPLNRRCANPWGNRLIRN
jgi:hypothetical protein